MIITFYSDTNPVTLAYMGSCGGFAQAWISPYSAPVSALPLTLPLLYVGG